jgi:hypothetical protein
MPIPSPTPLTILTGFLGSGKTTLLLSLLPQLPTGYKLCMLKNEFGDVTVDTKLAQQESVAGVKELLNGWYDILALHPPSPHSRSYLNRESQEMGPGANPFFFWTTAFAAILWGKCQMPCSHLRTTIILRG